MRSERKIIECIIRINPLIYILADIIEKEQDVLISDTASPAATIVEKLIELDNRRIDLCNLKVLYGFIECGLGDKFELLRASCFSGIDCGLYKQAAKQLECAGYSVERCESEFSYLFKRLKKPKLKVSGNLTSVPLMYRKSV